MMLCYFLLGSYLIIFLIKWGLSLSYSIKDGRKKANLSKDEETVTVIQPILSGDPSLQQMLEKNLLFNPNARFLWLIDQEDEEARLITDQLQKANPNHQIQIVACPDCPNGINPKLFKLVRGVQLIIEGKVIILDDDTTLPAQTLSALLQGLETNDLVTVLPYYLSSKGFWSLLVNQFVNSNSAMTYLSQAQLMGAVTINGMCYAMDREMIRRLNDFENIQEELTDDYALATLLKNIKWKICQISQPVFVHTSIKNRSHYVSLMHRWFVFSTILWRSESFINRSLIGFLYAGPPLLLLSTICLLPSVGSFYLVVLFGFLLLVRSMFLIMLNRTLTGKSHHHFPGSAISELLQPLHLLHACLHRSIRWRSRKYRVSAKGKFIEV